MTGGHILNDSRVYQINFLIGIVRPVIRNWHKSIHNYVAIASVQLSTAFTVISRMTAICES